MNGLDMFDPRLDLAYLAGCIDSDGCIGIKRNTYAMRVVKDSGQPTYSERVELKQVTPQVPYMLKESFGGGVRVEKNSLKNARPFYAWRVTDRKAARALRDLLPYLRIKREQAMNCLELRKVKEASKKVRVAKGRGHVGGARRPERFSCRMQALYENAKALNRIGIQPEEDPSDDHG